MPLPDVNQPWPPRPMHEPYRLYDTWGAWYSGDPDRLAHVYGATTGRFGLDLKNYDRPAQYQGGLLGRMARFFWGTPTPVGQLRSSKLHIPLAGDIASASSDLLFSDPPKIKVDDQSTQKRVDELMGAGDMHSVLLEATETAAAYGGVFLRVTWDTDLADHPLLDVISPDRAVPDWRFGRLTNVTFHRVVHESGDGQVWRHLERYEPGVVYHGLYQGTRDQLGRPVPLTDSPATEPFAALVNEQGAIPTATRGLATAYVPNMRPNRRRNLYPLGRSDYMGVEPMMDALDETWTSWMRDIRLGKARIMVPEAYLQSQGRGQGSFFDPDQEVFAAMNMLPRPDSAGSMITENQFAIRVEEHSRTASDLMTQILRSAGYSAQTFGEQGITAHTATEVNARENRSAITRGRKTNYWQPQLAHLVQAMLEIDAAVFGANVEPQKPTIEWPGDVRPGPEELGRTLQLLASAESASIETRVKMLHPEWEDSEIREEVERIKAEQGTQPPDPAELQHTLAGQFDQWDTQPQRASDQEGNPQDVQQVQRASRGGR